MVLALTSFLAISNKLNLLKETSIFIKIFEKYKKFSFKPEVLNNLYQIDDDIIEECTRLLIINNANNHSIKIFRYGLFNLFKKNFHKNTLNGEVFYKKNKLKYIDIFLKEFIEIYIGIYQFFINLLLIKTFYMTILKQRKFLKKIKK